MNHRYPFHRFQGCKFSLSCVVEKKYTSVYQTVDDEVDRAKNTMTITNVARQ